MSPDPLASLERMIDTALWAKSRRQQLPPGAIIGRAPREDREALAGLTSAHIRTVRQDIVALYIEPPLAGVARVGDYEGRTSSHRR
jgi:hypothetical protein